MIHYNERLPRTDTAASLSDVLYERIRVDTECREHGQQPPRYTITVHDPVAAQTIVRSGYLKEMYQTPGFPAPVLTPVLVNGRGKMCGHWPVTMIVRVAFANRRDGGILWERERAQ